MYVGLGVCSHDANVLETAVFSNVTLEQRPPRRTALSQQDHGLRSGDEASPTPVYTADQVIEAPNWSRDGKFLLVNTGGNLYRLPVGVGRPQAGEAGAGRRRLPLRTTITISPVTARLLAFSASSPNSRQSQVWLANADGSNAKLMTPPTPSYFHGWSPDGKWLAFVGQRDGKFDALPRTGRRRRRSSGSPPRATTTAPNTRRTASGSTSTPTAPAAGTSGACRAEGAGPDDAKAERVTNDEVEDWFPHFSPDGKWMLVFSLPQRHHEPQRQNGRRRSAPAADARQEAQAGEARDQIKFFGGQGTINVNSWSPDSKKFAYVVYEKL